MATAVTTKRTELGDARVRLDVEVGPDVVERELETAARELGRDMKLAGFRKGKVPPPVVIQRVGRAAVLDEAVRRALPAWYEQAVSEAGVVAVGDPKLALEELPEKARRSASRSRSPFGRPRGSATWDARGRPPRARGGR